MSNLSEFPMALNRRLDLDIDDSTVEVTISFPPITVPVADLRTWRRDFVVEMGMRLADVQLSVQAGGREIAKGYLVVRIEDHVGVVLSATERITS